VAKRLLLKKLTRKKKEGMPKEEEHNYNRTLIMGYGKTAGERERTGWGVLEQDTQKGRGRFSQELNRERKAEGLSPPETGLKRRTVSWWSSPITGTP